MGDEGSNDDLLLTVKLMIEVTSSDLRPTYDASDHRSTCPCARFVVFNENVNWVHYSNFTRG